MVDHPKRLDHLEVPVAKAKQVQATVAWLLIMEVKLTAEEPMEEVVLETQEVGQVEVTQLPLIRRLL
jgi:hypothetical protein